MHLNISKRLNSLYTQFKEHNTNIKSSVAKVSQEQITTDQTDLLTNKNQNNSVEYCHAIFENNTDAESALNTFRREKHPEAKMLWIKSIDDLLKSQLINKELVIDGEVIEQKGDLLSENNKDIILVVDYRGMPAEDRIRFNSLYSTPIIIGKQEVQANVTIISVVDDFLMSGKIPASKDLWRRIGLSKHRIYSSTQQKTTANNPSNSYFFNNRIKLFRQSSTSGANKVVTIDFNGKDWHKELFGYITIASDGSTFFKHSILKDSDCIILQDAPWHNYNFRNTLRSIIEKNEYVANGETIKIANHTQWYQKDTTLGIQDILDANRIFTEIEVSSLPEIFQKNSNNVAILNKDIWLECFSTTKIANNKLVTTDIFSDWLNNAQAILLTSDISSDQKAQLIVKLKKMHSKIPVYILSNDNFKDSEFQKNDKTTSTAIATKIKIELSDKDIVSKIKPDNYIENNNTNKTVVLQVSADSTLNNICTYTKLTDFKTQTFSVDKHEFLTALENGTPIKIFGLEDNKLLASQLELLLGMPPRLMLNGNIHEFKNADITVVLPKNKKLASPLWNHVVKTYNLPETELAEIKSFLQQKYDCSKECPDLSDKMVDQLKELICLINSTPKDEVTPKGRIHFNENLVSLVWDEITTILKNNPGRSLSASVSYEAVSRVLLQKFAGNREKYYYFKILAKYYFSEKEPAIYLNKEGIRNWINNKEEITHKTVEECFWQLLDYMPDCKHLFENKNLKKIRIITAKKILFTCLNIIGICLNIAINIYVCPTILIGVVAIIIGNIVILAVSYMLNRFLGYKGVFVNSADLDDIPKSAPISIEKNDEYFKMLAVIKANIIACAHEDDKIKLQNSLGVSNHNLKILESCCTQWVPLDKTVRKTLKYMQPIATTKSIHDGTSVATEAIKDKQAQEQLATKITELKYKYQNAITEEEINTINTDLMSILSNILPDDILTTKQEMLIKIFLENNALSEADKEFLYDLSQENKFSKIASLIEAHKINVFMGSAGTGKSYTAEQLSLRLSPDIKQFFINANKDTSTSNLFRHEVADYNIDGSCTIKSQQGVIEKWANTTSDKLIILRIDEANLAKPEIWNNLKTIYDPIPHIFCHGKRKNLTLNHRIIMTGNPDSKDGRTTNKFIKERAPVTYFKPLPVDFQRKVIVEKHLNKIIESTGILATENNRKVVAQLSNTVLSLYQQYKGVLPTHGFTPRDLIDCCSYVSFFLKNNKENIAIDKITIDMLNSVIYEAMYQAIGQKATAKESWKIPAINCWYKNNFATDTAIIDSTKKQFDGFIDELLLKYHSEKATNEAYCASENNNEMDFDFSNSLTQKMLYTLYIKFEMLNIEKTSSDINDVFLGRRILEIVGDAGIGKDKLLNLVSRHYRDKNQDDNIKILNINAGTRSEDEISKDIEEAFNKGYTIIFSEINQLASGTLEGILNDLATRKPAPGFHVFITVNPVSYNARKTMALALQSRFTTIYAGDFSEANLAKIANNILHDEKSSALLAKLHCKLIDDLTRNKLPQAPSVDNLIEAAKYLQNQDKNHESIQEAFEEAYYFFLDTADDYINKDIWSQEAIADNIIASSVNKDYNAVGYIPNITEWLLNNFARNLTDNIYVIAGSKDSFDIERNYIFLSNETLAKSEVEQQEIAVKLLVEYLWKIKQGGLGNCPINYNDKANATYKKWQQYFAKSILENSYVDKELLNIADIFPLNDTEEKLFNKLGEIRQLLLQSLFKLKPNVNNIKKMQCIIYTTANDKKLLSLANNMLTNDINILKTAIDNNSSSAEKILNIILTNNKLTTEYIHDLLNMVGSYDSKMLEKILLYILNNIVSSWYNIKEKKQLIRTVEFFNDNTCVNEENNKKHIQNIINTSNRWHENTNNENSNNIKNAQINNSTNNKQLIDLFNKSDNNSSFSTKNFKKPIQYLKQKAIDTKEALTEYYKYIIKDFEMTSRTDPLVKYQRNKLLHETKKEYGINYRLTNGFSLEGGTAELQQIVYNRHYTNISQKDYRKELAKKVKEKLNNLSTKERSKIDRYGSISKFVENMTSDKYVKATNNTQAAVDLIYSKIPEFVELGVDIIISANFFFEFTTYEWAVISNSLLSGIIPKEKVFELLKRLESKAYVNVGFMFTDSYKNLYSYLLKFSLENIKNQQNRELSIAVVNYIIDKEDFSKYINGSSANYLWGIHEEANMLDLSFKIKAILDTHYDSCFDKKQNIAFKSYRANIYSETYQADTMSKNASFPHIEKQLSAKKANLNYSWNASNVIDIDRISKKQPFYVSKKSNEYKPNIYLSSFPYIGNTETATTIYHRATGKYINLSHLINEENSSLIFKNSTPKSELNKIYKDFLLRNGINNVDRLDLLFIHKICYRACSMRYDSIKKTDNIVEGSNNFSHIDVEDINKAFFSKILEHGDITFCVAAEHNENAGIYKVTNYNELLKLREFLLNISFQVSGDYFSLASIEQSEYAGQFEKNKLKDLHNIIDEPIFSSHDLKIAMSEFIKSLNQHII